ncbi:MAG: protein kinase [Firmicutes bacterium]|nr:protein kinase [Bacillota bacterium]
MKCAFCGSENPAGFAVCSACGLKPDSPSKENSDKLGENDSDSSGVTGSSLQSGRYTIIRKLGAGGMGKIYLAHDSKMDANVVIKAMSPVLNDEEKKEYYQKQFETEAKLLYRLSYRGIPKVTDFFTDGEKNYLVMEFIEGENFENIIKGREKHRITIEEFFRWMDQLLSTLSYLHRQEPSIIHRDIKPSNLMLNKDGDIVLVDFGLAKSLNQHTTTQTQVGTLGYASPEHYTGKFSVASDVYSLGASFHYMLTGDPPNTRPPFDFPSVGMYRTDLPGYVVKILDKMLQRKTEKRYKSISEVRADFDQALFNYSKNSGKQDAPAKSEKTFIPAVKSKDENNTSSDIGQSLSKANTEISPDFSAYREMPEYHAYPDAGRTNMLPSQGANFWKTATIAIVIAMLAFWGIYSSGIMRKKDNLAAVDISGKSSSPSAQDLQDKTPDKLVIEGIQLMYDEKYSDALNNFNEAIKKDPTNPAAYKNRGMIYLKIGDTKKALHDLGESLALQPEDLDVLMVRAELNLQAGKYKESVKDLDKLLSLQPNNKENYYKRAFINNKLGRPDLAARDLDIILAIDPKEERARANLSRIYIKQASQLIEKKSYTKALEYCYKLTELDPRDAKAYYLKGYVHYALGRKEAALADFKKCLTINPNNDDALMYINRIQGELAPESPDDSVKIQMQMPSTENREQYPKALPKSEDKNRTE